MAVQRPEPKVLRESLRLMEQREKRDAAKMALLHARLDQAEQDVKNGALDNYTEDSLDEIDAEERREFAVAKPA